MAIKELKSIKFPGLEDTYVIPEGGTIDIDLAGSNEGEATPVNADTLGGYPADEYVKKDELENIKPSLSIEKNYSVVGGLEEPSNPTENMIWVQTETEIGKVYFSGIEPANCADNDIWISTSSNYSTVAFDSIRIGNDTMQTIYPISVKQYIGGALVDKTAKSYQGGDWVEWIIVLWNASENYENTNVLGTKGFYITKNNTSGGTLEKSSAGMILNSNKGDNEVAVSHDNLIDFTNLSEIIVSWDGGNNYADYQGIGVYPTNYNYGSSNAIAYLHKDNTIAETVTLDVSAINQKAYIIITAYNGALAVSKIDMK